MRVCVCVGGGGGAYTARWWFFPELKILFQSDVSTLETKSIFLWCFYTLINLHKSQYGNEPLGGLVQDTSA